MSKKRIFVLLIVTLTFLLLAGCSNGNVSSSETSFDESKTDFSGIETESENNNRTSDEDSSMDNIELPMT